MGHQFLSRNFKTSSWLAYVKVVQPYCILKLIIAIGWGKGSGGQFSYEIISGGVYSYGKYKVPKFSFKHSPLEHSKRSLPNRRHFCDTTTSFLTGNKEMSALFSGYLLLNSIMQGLVPSPPQNGVTQIVQAIT